MAETIGFGIKLTADNAGMVSGVGAAKDSVDKLSNSINEAQASAQRYSQSTRQTADVIAAQTRAMQGAAAAHQRSQSSIASNLEAQRKLDDELTRFLAVTDKAYRGQMLLDKGQDLLHRSLAAGLITQTQYDQRLASLVAKYGPAAAGAAGLKAANDGIGISVSFAAREVRALADELASGRTGQAVGTFTNVAGRILMVQPAATAAALAVLGMGAAYAYAVARSEGLNRSLVQTQALLSGTGRGGDLSTAQIRKYVEELERVRGISREAAEEIVSSFAKVRQIGPDLFGKLSGMVADFSAATGEDAPKAAQKLADAFGDPFKGAQALDEQLNILTSDQVLQLESMKRVGDVAGAQELLLKALEQRIKGLHKDALTPMGEALEKVGKAWGSVVNAMADSKAVKVATEALVGFLGTVERLITKLPTVAEKAAAFLTKISPAARVIASVVGALSSRMATAPPTDTAAGAGPAGRGTAPDPRFKDLIEATSGFKTTARAEAEMGEQAAKLREALATLRAENKQGTDTFKALQDRLQAISDRTAPTFESRIALITRTLQARQAAAQTEYSLTKDALDREAQLLDLHHQAGLVGEQTFLDRRLDIERRSAEARIAEIETEQQAEAEAYAKIAQARPRNRSEEARQSADLEAAKARLIKINAELQKAEAAVGDEAEKAGTRQLALDNAMFERVQQVGQGTRALLNDLKTESEERRFQLSLLGQSEEVQARLTAERQVRLKIEREIDALVTKIAQEESKRGGADQDVIQEARNRIAQLREDLPAAAKGAGDLAEEFALAARNTSLLSDAWRQVDDFLSGVFDHMKDGWRSMAQYARDQIQRFILRTLYELTAQRFGITLFANLTNAGPGTFSGAGQTASLAGSALGAVGGFAQPALASLLGGGTGGAVLASGALSAIGTALPYIGVAIALASMFSKPGGGPKEGGSFFGGYNASGAFTGSVGVPGSDNGRFFTPNARDSDLQGVVGGLAASYYSTIARLGGTAAAARFGLGYDTDPKGTAPNRISSNVTIGGRQVFGSQDRSVGRDDATLQAELQLEASRSLLAALQASELPSAVARIINSLDVRTASKQAIDDAISFADSYQQILKSGTDDVAQEAAKLYQTQTQSSRTALKAQGDALVELARKFDGSTASAQSLAQAQSAYRQSLVELLASIKSISEQVSGMFSQTREHIQLAGLSQQDTYNFYQSAADNKFASLLQAQDPAEVQRLAGQINDYYTQAFDLLTSQDQLANKQQFLTHLDDLDKAVNGKLKNLADAIAEESRKPFQVVGDKMEKAADKMADAAAKNSAAIDRFSDAVDRANAAPTVVYVGSGPSEVGA